MSSPFLETRTWSSIAISPGVTMQAWTWGEDAIDPVWVWVTKTWPKWRNAWWYLKFHFGYPNFECCFFHVFSLKVIRCFGRTLCDIFFHLSYSIPFKTRWSTPSKLKTLEVPKKCLTKTRCSIGGRWRRCLTLFVPLLLGIWRKHQTTSLKKSNRASFKPQEGGFSVFPSQCLR